MIQHAKFKSYVLHCRFLLEEERLPMNHPVVTGLAEHLTREHAHVELAKLSQELMTSSLTEETGPAATVQTSALSVSRTLNAGFEVTLVDDDTNEDDECYDGESMDDDDECDYVGTEHSSDTEESSEYEVLEDEVEEAEVTEALMADPELRRQLLRFVYQGCDLFASPQQPVPQASYPGLVVQLWGARRDILG